MGFSSSSTGRPGRPFGAWRLVDAGSPLHRLGCIRTAPGLVPPSAPPRDATLAEFDARVRYNLYACLSILPRHQRRHLAQAEHV